MTSPDAHPAVKFTRKLRASIILRHNSIQTIQFTRTRWVVHDYFMSAIDFLPSLSNFISIEWWDYLSKAWNSDSSKEFQSGWCLSDRLPKYISGMISPISEYGNTSPSFKFHNGKLFNPKSQKIFVYHWKITIGDKNLAPKIETNFY